MKKKRLRLECGGACPCAFSSEWKTGNVPSSQFRHEVRLFWLHAKQRTLSERQGPGRERRPKWRLLQGSKLTVWMQNDRIFAHASLVECVLRRSFSEHMAKERHRSAADNLSKSKADPARSNRRSLDHECEGSENLGRPKCSLGHFQTERVEPRN